MSAGEPPVDFDSLYRRHARDVYRFALFLSGRPDQADDITAETFARAWTSHAEIRVGTVKAYLFMIARNLFRAARRERARRGTLTPEVRDQAPDPETLAGDRIGLARVMAALQTLPEADRAVLLMRAEDGLSYDEIAAVTGLSVGAAKVKVHRTRAKLSAALKEER